MHRNTRRRPYRPYGYYFTTTNVSRGFTLLETKVFGHLLEHVIQFAAIVNYCKIIAYKINPDHIHMIVQIGKINTISQFMSSLKRNFTRQTNEILIRHNHIFHNHPEEGSNNPGWDSNPNRVMAINFRWQPSYHSHLITTKTDFDNHISYINNQHIKHQLSKNDFCYIDRLHVFKYR